MDTKGTRKKMWCKETMWNGKIILKKKLLGKKKLILEGTIQILSLRTMIFDGRGKL